MIYVKINENLYPATVTGRKSDIDWGNRESKSITLEMTYEEAITLFVDDLDWSIVCEDWEITETHDNSEFSIVGPVTDNRNGTVTVKMGKITAEEALAELMEVLV